MGSCDKNAIINVTNIPLSDYEKAVVQGGFVGTEDDWNYIPSPGGHSGSIELYTNISNGVTSGLLTDRKVLLVFVDNMALQSTNFYKAVGSNTLVFTNGVMIEPGKLITLIFE